jgi:hypothetical protein
VTGGVRHLSALVDRFVAAWSRRVNIRVTVCGVVLLAIVALGYASVSLHIKPAFYEVSAEVLPIMLLAIIVESRYFRGVEDRDRTGRVVLKAFFVVPILGELATLVCVATGRDDMIARGTVFEAYLVTLALLWAFASDGPATGLSRRAVALADAARQVRAASRAREKA